MLLFMVRVKSKRPLLAKIKVVFVCTVGMTRKIPRTTSGAMGIEEKCR
jgi:hypothetical protein